ncbi:MAG: CpaF/VirB11 family protein [Oscillospiraceae bacterium]
MKKDFYDLLQSAQEYISKNYAQVLENGSEENSELLESYLANYLDANTLEVDDLDRNSLMQRLIDEMMRFSFLTGYLQRDDVEEVNINNWQDVKISYSNGQVLPAKECFFSASHAVDVVRRMLRESNIVWDNATPIQVGHLPGNIRITAVGYDVVDLDKALAVSIRKVNPKKLEKQDFIENKTATEEMLDFLTMIYTHGISFCFTGATGSGKTTLLSWVLGYVPYNKRLISIEQGTREFDCTVRDTSGKVLNNIVHLSTRRSDDSKQDITQVKLLETIMTMNPDYIAVGESKGEEAMQTVNAANTGHSVITTTHANSAEDTYFRFVSLCKLKYPNMDEKLLMMLTVRAFPIAVFVKKLEDNSRKIMKINEARCDENGTVHYTTLYQYIIQKNEIQNGKVTVSGRFEKVANLSDELQSRLLDNGVPQSRLKEFMKGK